MWCNTHAFMGQALREYPAAGPEAFELQLRLEGFGLVIEATRTAVATPSKDPPFFVQLKAIWLDLWTLALWETLAAGLAAAKCRVPRKMPGYQAGATLKRTELKIKELGLRRFWPLFP